jgi:hypothetical protein
MGGSLTGIRLPMRLTRWLVLSGFVCVLLRGLDAAAPHPTLLTLRYDGAYHPVIKVIGTDPVIVVKGKEKRIRSEIRYVPSRMEAYANGSVEIEEASVGKLTLHTHPESATSLLEEEDAGRRGSRSEVKVRLRSAAPLVGGMIAVVLYPESTLYTPTAGMGAGAEIEVRALPDLPAGERVTVEFTARSFFYRQDQSFFVQVFDREGQEVLTNVVRKAWPYYAAVERFKLLDTLQHMRKAGERKDMDPRPVLMIRPLLPENAVLPSGAVFAQLSISPEGTVTEINLDPLESTAVSAALREALGGWLFVPRLKAGEPVESTVRVPIGF